MDNHLLEKIDQKSSFILSALSTMGFEPKEEDIKAEQDFTEVLDDDIEAEQDLLQANIEELEEIVEDTEIDIIVNKIVNAALMEAGMLEDADDAQYEDLTEEFDVEDIMLIQHFKEDIIEALNENYGDEEYYHLLIEKIGELTND